MAHFLPVCLSHTVCPFPPSTQVQFFQAPGEPPFCRVPILCCPAVPFFSYFGEAFPFKLNQKQQGPVATGHLRICWWVRDSNFVSGGRRLRAGALDPLGEAHRAAHPLRGPRQCSQPALRLFFPGVKPIGSTTSLGQPC